MSSCPKVLVSSCPQVRLFYRKPDFALIDEGTSAVDQHGVQSLYSAAKAMGITLLTISHHGELEEF